ncbi:hypothetical protein K440DRAFT_630912 [Wilcoxina mikolae CBS 423.85]|nr:hypothetical protein K440DRAFT_630912 [Wilcoxina mikolae CBS 423.85]
MTNNAPLPPSRQQTSPLDLSSESDVPIPPHRNYNGMTNNSSLLLANKPHSPTKPHLTSPHLTPNAPQTPEISKTTKEPETSSSYTTQGPGPG